MSLLTNQNLASPYLGVLLKRLLAVRKMPISIEFAYSASRISVNWISRPLSLRELDFRPWLPAKSRWQALVFDSIAL
jgi:hypothetical protein